MPVALSWDRAGLRRILACAEAEGGVGMVRAACIFRAGIAISFWPPMFLSDFVVWLHLPLLVWVVFLLFISDCLCPSFTLFGCLRFCVFIPGSVPVCVPLSLSPSAFKSYLLGPLCTSCSARGGDTVLRKDAQFWKRAMNPRFTPLSTCLFSVTGERDLGCITAGGGRFSVSLVVTELKLEGRTLS